MTKKPTPKLINVEQVSEGWVNKYILTYQLPSGELYTYEGTSRKNLKDYKAALEANGRGETSRPDAVCMVPLLKNNEILLIKEFRYPLNSWCIAFPAGLMEPDEVVTECIVRELKEETGYKIRTLVDGQSIFPLEQAGYSSTGLTEENVEVVFVLVEPDGDSTPELGEFIEPFTLAIKDIPQFLATNRVPIGTRCQLVLEALATADHQGIIERTLACS